MTEQQVDDDKKTAEKDFGASAKKTLRDLGEQVEKFAQKTFSSVKKSIDKAMAGRNTVLSVRVSDETNQKLDILVESGLFRSRSESAAFLIDEGIKNQKELFTKIEKKMTQIQKLKDELKGIIGEEMAAKQNQEDKKSKAQANT